MKQKPGYADYGKIQRTRLTLLYLLVMVGVTLPAILSAGTASARRSPPGREAQVWAMPLRQPGQAAGTSTPTMTATRAPTDSSYPPPVSEAPSYTPVSYPGPGTQVPETLASPGTSSPLPTATGVTLVPRTPTPPGTPPFGAASPTAALTTGIVTTSPLTATTTLIPMPELTLVFPKTREAALLVTATEEAPPAEGPWSSPQRIAPLALVLLVWLILGVWFYYSQRNL